MQTLDLRGQSAFLAGQLPQNAEYAGTQIGRIYVAVQVTHS